MVSTPEIPISPPRPSRDATLTAFAQLGALRLNAKWGLISLAARKYQYIIAEATRTLSLRDNGMNDEADALWKGETTVGRGDGPCSVAMDLFTGIAEGVHNHLLVSDLSADDRFRHMEPVAKSPFMRFFVAVPLLTDKGLVLGAFYVLDERPRNAISNTEMAFMKDMSSSIVAHLEAKRVKQQHKRAERMIRGLGLYVEGKSSLRDWWLNTGHKTNAFEVAEKARQGERMMQQADQEFGHQDSPDALATSAVADIPSTLQHRRNTTFKSSLNNPPTRRRPHYRQDSSSDTVPSVMPSGTTDTTFTNQPGAYRSILTRQTSMPTPYSVLPEPHNRQGPSHDPGDETWGADLQEAILSKELKESFARASNLIRESIAVEGVLFLDASVGTFGGSSKNSDLGFSGPSAWNNQSTAFAPSSSDEARQRSVIFTQCH